jgi:hypothetical protein
MRTDGHVWFAQGAKLAGFAVLRGGAVAFV